MGMMKMTALLAALCLCLSGCAMNGGVENQAYALVMGVDRTEAGIALTIRIPRIGHSAGDTNSQSQDSDPYMSLSASGGTYGEALEALQWVCARELNLSQLKLLIVSEDLAASQDFHDLARSIALTRHLYTTAALVVCEGRAGAFVVSLETILGTRLSSEIAALFRHYAAHGFIPLGTFADMVYASDSCYSDPVAVLAGLGAEDGTQPDGRQRYLGGAVFRDGRLRQKLDIQETLCLDLLRDRVRTFSWTCMGQSYPLTGLFRPSHRVSIDGGHVSVDVGVTLASEKELKAEERAALEADIGRALDGFIATCQRAGTEPFGFAAKAALRFPDFPAWLAFDWSARFAQASVKVDVKVSGPSV